MRAREPDESGYAVNGGIRLYYKVFGRSGAARAGASVVLDIAPRLAAPF
jgi:hypothetical protein